MLIELLCILMLSVFHFEVCYGDDKILKKKTFLNNIPSTDFSWTVSIHENSTLKCAGSLIKTYFVLTAARCVNGDPQKYTYYIGDNSEKWFAKNTQISNDTILAVVELKTNKNKIKVKPIKLIPGDHRLYKLINRIVVLAGYRNAEGPKMLIHETAQVCNFDYCEKFNRFCIRSKMDEYVVNNAGGCGIAFEQSTGEWNLVGIVIGKENTTNTNITQNVCDTMSGMGMYIGPYIMWIDKIMSPKKITTA